MNDRLRRAAWLTAVTAFALVGLLKIAASKASGEPYVDARAIALYVVVLTLVLSLGYVVHRTVGRRRPSFARRQAVLDALVSGLLAPILLAAAIVVGTVSECLHGCP